MHFNGKRFHKTIKFLWNLLFYECIGLVWNPLDYLPQPSLWFKKGC